MKRLVIAAVGLALVVGILVGGMVGNPFHGTASAAPTPTPFALHVAEQDLDANGNIKVHEQGTANVNVVSMPSSGGGACYTNWNSADCAPGFNAVATGEWTTLFGAADLGPPFPDGAVGLGIICAAPKSGNTVGFGLSTYSKTTTSNLVEHMVNDEPCAICCK